MKHPLDHGCFAGLFVPRTSQISFDLIRETVFAVFFAVPRTETFSEWRITMKEKLAELREKALTQIGASEGLERLNDIRVAFLGKKGELTSMLKSLKDVAPEERPTVGQMVNEARAAIEEKLEERRRAFEKKFQEEKLKAETIDVTLPAKKPLIGHRHPNTIALEEVERIFVGMGYEVVEGPEVEYDYYNFEALNIPKNHPARDEQDTFYITDNIVLRTQTSSVQAHVMEHTKPPIRIIAPGRVFRSDEVDATHSPSFHQIEGDRKSTRLNSSHS